MAVMKKQTISAQKLLELRRSLCERTKELKCIYSISELVDEPHLSLDQILRRLPTIIARAWQHPQICKVRIAVWGRDYTSPKFRVTKWKQSADVKCKGEVVGRIEVCYKKRLPKMGEVPFLEEERHLLNVIAERVGKIMERAVAESALRGSIEQLRSLSTHLQYVREQERARIAHELHDELGQALTALKIDLACLRKKLPSTNFEIDRRVQLMRQVIDDTIHSTQRICAELRPAMLDDLGLVPAILWQSREFRERTGIKCLVSIKPDNIEPSDEQSTALFRIFQEALTNVCRHANASDVRVDLCRYKSRLSLTIRDNGKGISRAKVHDPASFGLFGIRERVRQLGGRFSIRGRSGKGTILKVVIPIGKAGLQK
jgi:signal transduction histidine kinase